MQAKDLAKEGIIAALYAVICMTLAPISYGEIQLRISEMLMVLPFYNKRHTIGLTLGCFIANLYSVELGVWDLIFGTSATFIACVIVGRLKTMVLIAPVTAVVNGIIIGAELHFILGLPLIFSAAAVAAGELVAVYAGVAVMKIVEKNKTVKEFLY